MLNIFYKNYYMETLIKPSVFVLAAVLACTNLHAQTADEVVNKYVAAIGGKPAIESVKTLYIESDAEAMGNQLPSVTWIVNGKGYKNEVDFNGTKIVNCFSEKGGWSINPMTGASTATAMPEEQTKSMKGQMNVGGPLYDYAAKGSKIELVPGKDAADSDYRIKLTAAAATTTFSINKKTYYIDKSVTSANMMGQDVEITVSFSDYRKIDGGYVLAFSQSIVNPQYTVNITHKKVEVNKPIDPAIFDMPK